MMKKLLIALFAVSLLFAPVGVVAQDTDPAMPGTAPVSVVEIPAPAPDVAPVEEVAPVEPIKEQPPKLPWTVVFFWPLIATASVSIIKVLSDKLKKEAPPQLWPILNTVIVAIIVGIQTSGTPQVVIANIVAAVLAALGFTKTLDVATNKAATISPTLKATLRAKGVIPA